jgi:hypothetical protein
MKKATDKAAEPEMRRDYDFSGGVRGNYARPYARGASALTIRRLRGILKRQPGAKPLAEEMAEYKREEKALEKGRIDR